MTKKVQLLLHLIFQFTNSIIILPKCFTYFFISPKHILEATSNITINSYNDVFNYINVIQSFDSILTKAITLSIKAYLEELDYNYTISNERKCKYHIKDYRARTILTIFGEITYSRHFFKSKLDGSSFCYVDRQLSL